MNRRKAMAVASVALLLLAGGTGVVLLLRKPDVDSYERTTMRVDVVVTLSNLGNSIATNIPLRLALPLEVPSVQHVSRLSYSEPPQRYSNDSWGNSFAHFEVDNLGPADEHVITLTMELVMTSVDWNLGREDVGAYGPGLERYLEETVFLNFNDAGVLAMSHTLGDRSSDVLDLAWRTYSWVVDNMVYQQVAGELDAATALKNGEGGSAELANLWVALMRANGVPARRVSGWGNHFAAGEELTVARFAHGWAEFLVPGYGWIPVDPTWGQTNKFDSFAKADGSHVALTTEAGIHFLQRGAFDEPYGPTDVGTDYVLIVRSVTLDNLSFKRDLIAGMIFSPPLAFAAFVISKRARQRMVG